VASKNFYVYITLTPHNTFINCYKDTNNGSKEPIGFKQLSSDKFLVGKPKPKKDWEHLKELAEKLSTWILNFHNAPVTLVFKNSGMIFRRRNQTCWNLEKKQSFFIEAFNKANIVFNAIVDVSAIPFNGCKALNRRRKKKKYMIKQVDTEQ
jgi:hypothetical protein